MSTASSASRWPSLKHRLVTMGVLFTVGSSVLLAADFWLQKKFSEWTDKEVSRMLLDSPWARRATVELKGSVVVEAPGAVPAIEVVVRWQTALPVKMAIARFHYGNYTEPSWNITKMLYLDEPYYIAGILGLPRRLAGQHPEDLTSFATLRIKDQPPIQAVAVLPEELMSGAVNLFFFFPKLQEGARRITLDDKEVEVGLENATMELRRTFSLRDLMYDGKLEM